MRISNVIFSKRTYQKFVNNLPIVTVDILFFNELLTKTLLFKRANNPLKNTFFTCGGRLMKNETFKKAASRIVQKELGLKIDSKKLFFGGVNNEIHRNSIFPKVNYHCVDIFFGYILTEDTFRKIKMDQQHSKNKWFSVKNARLNILVIQKINSLLKHHDKTY